MATNPSYSDRVILGIGEISTANTNYDGTGTMVDIVLASAYPRKGIEVTKIRAQAQGTVADGKVNIFVKDGSSNYHYYDTITLSAGDQTDGELNFNDLFIPPGSGISAAPYAAETINIFVHGSEY